VLLLRHGNTDRAADASVEADMARVLTFPGRQQVCVCVCVTKRECVYVCVDKHTCLCVDTHTHTHTYTPAKPG
jgi:hypothetical protein